MLHLSIVLFLQTLHSSDVHPASNSFYFSTPHMNQLQAGFTLHTDPFTTHNARFNLEQNNNLPSTTTILNLCLINVNRLV